jgi:hypothetical protein
MAAVTGNLEWSDENTGIGETPDVFHLPVLQGFGDDAPVAAVKSGRKTKRGAALLERSHASLTRLLWIRRTVELYLSGRGRDKQVRQILLAGVNEGKGELRMVIEPAIPNNAIPWAFADQGIPSIGLWGEANSKMQAPTFDLPAGPDDQGGSCPGASFGQTTSTLVERNREAGRPTMIPPSPGGAEPEKELDVKEAICQSCYATGGSYAYLVQQVTEVVRLWWVKSCIAKGEAGRREFVEVMLRGLTALEFNATTWSHQGKRVPLEQGIWPVRVHASGDFFLPEYAAWWMDVANEAAKILPKVHFWAPTRTWVTWAQLWPGILGKLKQDNFSIRPSGFHVGENAPGPLAEGVFGASMGSTSIYAHDNQKANDLRYDFNCGVFEKDPVTGQAAKSCDRANAPDGKPGCRACWVRPDLRINYQNH